ncbi:MAG: cache domain-containing protein [Candidatus Omnitrophica bacterium]|nr:cache domain-containing protein [Candidatus Omnitrophota bacterium]
MKKLQIKLFKTLLLSSLVPLVSVGIISVILLHRFAVISAEQRLMNHLLIAKAVYQSQLDNLKFIIRDQNRRVYTLMAEDQLDLLKNEYQKVIKTYNLDFFVVTDRFGKVIVSITNPQLEEKDLASDYYIRKALRGQMVVGTEVWEQDMLEKFNLKEKAQIDDTQAVRGLVMRATLPVINNNEIIVGTMTAGYLLNNNSLVIDKITHATDLVASIFLGDMRICSNVPFRLPQKALGGRLPQATVRTILDQRKEYIGKINVAGESYHASYTPLYDVNNQPIGILGVGLPEKSIFAQRNELTKLFIIAVVISCCFSLLIGIINGGAIVTSVNKLYWGIEAFVRGDFTHQIEINSGDELQELAEFFNKTMQRLMDTMKQLESCSHNVRQLETKVWESSQQLEAAQKQLVEYERMAAMGRMATSVSHELRNNFAEIRTSLYNLKTKLAKEAPQFVSLLNCIEESLTSASQTIDNVLRFSYPKKLIFTDVDVNYLLESLLSDAKLKDALRNNKIRVDKEFQHNLPHIQADGLQLREAVHNILVNAIQAMPEAGRLGLFTYEQQGYVHIKIVDTGIGMSKEVLNNIFTPFFTTKNRGLGLGLCLTQNIIKEHNGTIQVFSEPGQGTTFIIILPIERSTIQPQSSSS